MDASFNMIFDQNNETFFKREFEFLSFIVQNNIKFHLTAVQPKIKYGKRISEMAYALIIKFDLEFFLQTFPLMQKWPAWTSNVYICKRRRVWRQNRDGPGFQQKICFSLQTHEWAFPLNMLEHQKNKFRCLAEPPKPVEETLNIKARLSNQKLIFDSWQSLWNYGNEDFKSLHGMDHTPKSQSFNDRYTGIFYCRWITSCDYYYYDVVAFYNAIDNWKKTLFKISRVIKVVYFKLIY